MSNNPVRRNCAKPHSCPTEVRMKVLAKAPLTRELTDEQRAELDGHLSSWSWGEGDPILLAGEEATGSYMLASGRARITRDTADGREVTIDIAAPGDIIGPVSTTPTAAAHSAWAMETCCALFLPAAVLAEVVDAYPRVALGIIRFQERQLRHYRERESAQLSSTVEQRVAATLLRLGKKLGATQPDGSRLLQVRLRRDDIAGMSSTTIESASRAMSKMKKAGLIDSGREWVSLLDIDALTDLVEAP